MMFLRRGSPNLFCQFVSVLFLVTMANHNQGVEFTAFRLGDGVDLTIRVNSMEQRLEFDRKTFLLAWLRSLRLELGEPNGAVSKQFEDEIQKNESKPIKGRKGEDYQTLRTCSWSRRRNENSFKILFSQNREL
jgi:hypothetical protein